MICLAHEITDRPKNAIDISCERSSSLSTSSACGRPIGMLTFPISLTPTRQANMDWLTTERNTSRGDVTFEAGDKSVIDASRFGMQGRGE